MTKSEIQDAANVDHIRKLRANGHHFEFTTFRTAKGSVAVCLRLWHRNDTKRINELAGGCLGKFVSQKYAAAYIQQMEAV